MTPTSWSVLDRAGQQAISFLIFIVLARILGPSEYGVASVIFVYLFLVNTTLTGVIDGVISKQIRNVRLLSSLFWFTVVLGILFRVLSFFFGFLLFFLIAIQVLVEGFFQFLFFLFIR